MIQRSPKSLFEGRTRWLIVWTLGVFCGVSFGISYGGPESNHPVYLIDGLRMVDASFLEHDWWASDGAQYHRFFSYLVALLADAGVLEAGLAIANVASVAIVVALIYRLVQTLVPNHKFAVWALIILVFVVAYQTGGAAYTYLFSPSLQPSTIGAVLWVVALTYFILGRYGLSGLALGIGGLFHANLLILGFPVYGLAHLGLGSNNLIRRCLVQFAPSLFAAAVLAPEILSGLAPTIDPEIRAQAHHLIMVVNAQFHHVPAAAPWSFLTLAGWSLIAFVFSRQLVIRSPNPACQRLVILFASMAFLLITATLLTTVVFVDEVSRLFVWRLSPYATLLALLITASYLVLAPRQSADTTILKIGSSKTFLVSAGTVFILIDLALRLGWPSTWKWVAALGAALLFLTIITCWIWRHIEIVRGAVSSVIRALVKAPHILVAMIFVTATIQADQQDFDLVCGPCVNGDERDLFGWAATTRPDSQFLVPPNLSQFRLFAGRAIVADWKAVPIQPERTVEWHRRLVAMSGPDNASDRWAMVRGYDDMPAKRLKALVDEFDIDYFVTKKNTASATLGQERVFENDSFIVFKAP